ncbi:MAG: hypothetical protein K8F91_00585, partial [Candidatus Obscuribacterales bacterium]|nr:hypothetical protein [Candidatus Obscuribacterales bacterium]
AKETKIFSCCKAVNSEHVDLGFVGEIKSVDTQLLPADKISIVAPIGFDEHGQKYNLNADHAAMALSAALKAETLIFLSDVEGIMLDLNDKTSLISHIEPDQARSLILNGSIKGGMIQKVLNSLMAIKLGVRRVCITDGRRSGTLIEAALNQLLHGTTFSAT